MVVWGCEFDLVAEESFWMIEIESGIVAIQCPPCVDLPLRR